MVRDAGASVRVQPSRPPYKGPLGVRSVLMAHLPVTRGCTGESLVRDAKQGRNVLYLAGTAKCTRLPIEEYISWIFLHEQGQHLAFKSLPEHAKREASQSQNDVVTEVPARDLPGPKRPFSTVESRARLLRWPLALGL